MRRLLLLTVVAFLVAVPAAAHDATPKTYTVKTGDDFFEPTKRTIHLKDIIKWVWVGADKRPGETVNEHTIAERDGKLKLLSPTKTSGTYKFRFKKAGKFVIICAEHPDSMKFRVTVKR